MAGAIQAEAELVAGLRPFIKRELVRALGEDFEADFSPPPNADGPALLRYLDDKWMSVFDDSPIHSHRELIRSAYKALITGKRASRNDASDIEAIRYVERVLQAIGASGLSARTANGVANTTSAIVSPRNSRSHGNDSSSNLSCWEDRFANDYGGLRNVDSSAVNSSHKSPTSRDCGPSNFSARSTHKRFSSFSNISHQSSDFGFTTGDPAYGGGRPRTRKVDADGDMAMGDAIIESQHSVIHHMTTPRPSNAIYPSRGDDAAMLDIDEGPISKGPVAVVLDGANIGWKRGVNQFSMAGAAAALAYFQRRGHPCTLVLPEGRFRAPSNTDDEATRWVRELRGTEALLEAPDSDYDDAYVTGLARRTAAIVVSNDKFADQIYQAQANGEHAAREWREYLAKCRCSFAFVGDTFVPNPAFDFVRAAEAARRYAVPPD